MMNGSKILERYTPEFDATIVTRILDAGGRIMGKTACEDLCWSGGSFTCSKGSVRNPYDETRMTGGSSSGSAALVAGGIIDMAIGGDQGGSIRIPASWTGIVGVKPTYGLVPYTGAMSTDPTIDHLGPMSRTVHDCALLLDVIAGYDHGRDSRQPNIMSSQSYSDEVDCGIAGKKIGVVREGFDVCSDNDVAKIVRKAVYRLEEANAVVEEISVPQHLDGAGIWYCLSQGAYNGIVEGNATLWKGYHPLSMQEAAHRGMVTRPYDMHITMKMMSITGKYMNKMYGSRFYAMAQNASLMLKETYDKVLEKYDLLVMPTMLSKALKIPSSNASTADLIKSCRLLSRNTRPFNVTGHPALSINAGFSEGLPVGMMIVGRHFDEMTVLQAARAYEKIRDHK